ncbi:BQ5605_C006g04013 [Microbotryum silenes-dioicae]|uniref:BQ5605_C006g04013 protein n=1 Tax=Microbotryum silenes-dioicae TaxID=796604 RepID=A0A2X0M9W5_9BASI|nr:BQ5605_C006g04013 [Microbotryum silenes-dioicae]
MAEAGSEAPEWMLSESLNGRGMSSGSGMAKALANLAAARTSFAPFQAGFHYCGSRGQCDATNFIPSPRYLAESVNLPWTGQLTSPASGTNGPTTLPSDDLRNSNYAAMAEAMRMRATEISRSLARPHAGQHPSLHVSTQGRESQGNQIGMPILVIV